MPDKPPVRVLMSYADGCFSGMANAPCTIMIEDSDSPDDYEDRLHTITPTVVTDAEIDAEMEKSRAQEEK